MSTKQTEMDDASSSSSPKQDKNIKKHPKDKDSATSPKSSDSDSDSPDSESPDSDSPDLDSPDSESPDSDSPESPPSDSPPSPPPPSKPPSTSPSPSPTSKSPSSSRPSTKNLSPSPSSKYSSPSPPSPSSKDSSAPPQLPLLPSPPPPSPLPSSLPPPSPAPSPPRPSPSYSPPTPSSPRSPPPPSSPPHRSTQSYPLLWQNDNSSPSPRKNSPPPSPQFYAPPPLDKPSTNSLRDAASNDSTTGSSWNSQATGSSPRVKRGVNSHANSTVSSPAPGDNSEKYVTYTVAGLLAFALVAVAVAVAFALVFKRKKSRDDANGAPYMPPLDIQVKSGANGHYYEQQPSLANTIGNGNANVKHFGSPLNSPQLKSAPIVFTYEMVMEITNAFSSQNVIGEGGFGCVYKGLLPDGKGVAVKQLRAGSGQGEREFKAEVEIISRVHHRYLVSLVGYCVSEQQRILIYEYVPNGTLHHHLHGRAMPVLDWCKRLKIAIGAAKGLAYLHEDCSQKIIHRDIKSANILLDDAFEAKVADFGLARLSDAANTHVSTRVMGTFGYMAPEYATSGKLTDRSDVYSFGVVLLELVTGRKPVDQTQPIGDESLVEWARPLLIRAMETRNFSELVDPRLEKQFVESEMSRMVEAAAACVRHSAPKRPRMVQVVRALDTVDESSDLSNGVKYGQSTNYDSGQYDKEIMLFKRLANGTFVDSDFDSREYSLSRQTSRGSQQELIRYSSSGESEPRA
ncbi:hypothetical protein VNO80_23223 [Phaseolus coccineus]|uniref:non-specific serine/threonine protein kinase n=1 Tax=Phaseolus coccineus TaxID=3886 RepID=A0AAN9QVM0_PHACN